MEGATSQARMPARWGIPSASVHGNVRQQQQEINGMDTDFAMQMEEVTLAALDRITREVKRLSELVQTVNYRQTCFDLGSWGGQPSEGG